MGDLKTFISTIHYIYIYILCLFKIAHYCTNKEETLNTIHKHSQYLIRFMQTQPHSTLPCS